MKVFKFIVGVSGLIYILYTMDDMITGRGLFGSLFVIIFTIIYVYLMFMLLNQWDTD